MVEWEPFVKLWMRTASPTSESSGIVIVVALRIAKLAIEWQFDQWR